MYICACTRILVALIWYACTMHMCFNVNKSYGFAFWQGSCCCSSFAVCQSYKGSKSKLWVAFSFQSMLFHSDLNTLPIYLLVLLMIKVSIFGILLNLALTSIFMIFPSLTCSHLIPKILLITEWWKTLRQFRLFLVKFLDSHPHDNMFNMLAT